MAQVKTAAVIGGGIGGLSTALALHQRGIQATVYERAAAFGEVGTGISLWPNATRVLRRLDVLEPVVAASGAISFLSVKEPSGGTLLRVSTDHYDAPSICAYRPALIEALYAALPDGAVQFGKQLVRIEEQSHAAVAHFADGDRAEADVLIGADGIRSAVRSFVWPDAQPIYQGYPVWRGLGPLPSSMPPGEASETWGDGLRFGLLHTGQNRSYWYATAGQAEGITQENPAAEKQRLLDVFASWHAPIAEVIEQTPAEAIYLNDVYDLKPARGWHRGRVVLMGDAVHATTPNLGQGGCMAIEDAWALAEQLQRQPYSEAFAAFEKARYRRTARVTSQSRWIGQMGLWGGLGARVRNTLTQLTPAPMYAASNGWLFNHGR